MVCCEVFNRNQRIIRFLFLHSYLEAAYLDIGTIYMVCENVVFCNWSTMLCNLYWNIIFVHFNNELFRSFALSKSPTLCSVWTFEWKGIFSSLFSFFLSKKSLDWLRLTRFEYDGQTKRNGNSFFNQPDLLYNANISYYSIKITVEK